MADGTILLAILLVLQSYAAHISKSSRRQNYKTLLLWLEVIKQSQIKQKQPGRQQQLEKRGVWEGQQRLTTFQQDTCLRQSVPYYSLGDHSPVPALRRHRASPSRPSGDRN